MAKNNAVESTVQIVNRQLVSLEGTLISRTKSAVLFKYRPRGKRIQVQKAFPISACRKIGLNEIVVEILTKIGRPIKGVAEIKDDGVYVDGVWFDPNTVEVTAELGIEDEAPKKSKGDKKKKAK